MQCPAMLSAICGNSREVVLPNSVNRLCNGAFRSCGISKMVIPAGVRTIDYNVFNASSGLLDIWVSNSNPVYINWCVLHATPTSRMTLHCPSEAAVNNYKAKGILEGHCQHHR